MLKQTWTNKFLGYCQKGPPFLELSSIQISEPNIRPTKRNIISDRSQKSLLIDQRCRLKIIAKCVSLSHNVCGCWPTLSAVSTSAHTHTHSLSLCLSVCLLSFLTFSFQIKTLFPDCLIIIGNTDFTVFGCSHFIGSINTKVCLEITS